MMLLLLSCLAASASLTYFSSSLPLSVFSLSLCCGLQSDSTFFLHGAGPCSGGVEVAASLSVAVGGAILQGGLKHMCSVAGKAQRSQFPPLASHLQDVEEPRPEGRVWFTRDSSSINTAGPRHASLFYQCGESLLPRGTDSAINQGRECGSKASVNIASV